MLSTFVLVVIGWIIFRSETIGQALDYLGQLFSLSLLHISLPYGKKALFFVFVMMLLEWFSRETDFPMHDLSDKIFKYRWMRIMLYYILIMVTLIAAGSQETFIYFQF